MTLKNAKDKLRHASWKTTAIGVVTGIVMLGSAFLAQTDDNPDNDPDWLTVVPLALSAMGIGVFARDNNRSSEDVGARR